MASGKLTPDLMADHRVYIHEFDAENPLPPHLDALRQSILDFDFTVDKRLDRNGGATPMSPESQYDSDEDNDDEIRALKKADKNQLNHYKDAAREANLRFHGDDPEKAWEILYLNFFFAPLHERTLPKKSDSRAYV